MNFTINSGDAECASIPRSLQKLQNRRHPEPYAFLVFALMWFERKSWSSNLFIQCIRIATVDYYYLFLMWKAYRGSILGSTSVLPLRYTRLSRSS